MGGGLAGRGATLKATIGSAIATQSQERFVAYCSELKKSKSATFQMQVLRCKSAISPRDAPELLMNRPPTEEEGQGMPGACCTRGLVCKNVHRNAHEHTGTDGAFRHSLRNGFTAYTVLSPATNSSCHRR
jgi:hypothetical protein